MSKKQDKKLRKPNPKQIKKQEYSFLKCLPYIILILAVLVVYCNSLKNKFAYDDHFVITEKFLGQGFGALPDFFSHEYFQTSGEQTYRPLVTLSHLIEYPLWGQNPLGYHIINLILHLIVTILIFNYLKNIFSLWPALMGSLIFGIHPAISEAVNAISFREDILCALFFMLALTFSEKKNITRWKKNLNMSVFYLLALFSKEMALTFPIIFVFFNWMKPGEEKNRSKYIWVFIVTLFYLFIRFYVMSNPDVEKATYYGIAGVNPLINLPKILLRYLFLIVFPLHLSADWYLSPVKSVFDPYFLCGFLAIAGLIFLVVKYRKSWGWGIGWFLITLLPVLNFIPLNNPIAERYLYLPMVGIAIIIAFLLNKFKHIPVPLIWVVILCCILLGTRTFIRNFDWYDNQTLFSAAMEYPHTNRTPYNLGTILSHQDKDQEALKFFNEAYSIKPDNVDIINNLGLAYMKTGDYTKAVEFFTKALSIEPNNHTIHNNLGNTYLDAGQIDKAEIEYRTALKLKSDYTIGILNLAKVLERKKQFGEVTYLYNQLIEIDPENLRYKESLGIIYLKQGLWEKAIGINREILSNDPDNHGAMNNLARILAACPDGKFRDGQESIKLAKRACELTNWITDAYIDTLAAAYAEIGDFENAVNTEKEAIKLAPKQFQSQLKSHLDLYLEHKPLRVNQ